MFEQSNTIDPDVMSALIDQAGGDRRSSGTPDEPAVVKEARMQAARSFCACHLVRKVAMVGGVAAAIYLGLRAIR